MALNYKQVVPMYAVFMAALTFTLSSIPGQPDHQSTSLSSEGSEFADTNRDDTYSDGYLSGDSIYKDGCDVQRTFSRDHEVRKAGCALAPKTFAGDLGDFRVHGSVKVEYKKISRSNDDRTANTEVEKLVITITTSADGLGTRSHTLYRDPSEWSGINGIIKEAYDVQAGEMSKKVHERQRVINCDIDNNGKTVAPERQPDCRLEKLSNMSDAQGEAYYNKYFKNDLETLLKSTDSAKQAAGMKMLMLMEQKGIRSKSVQNELLNADKYVKYQVDLSTLTDKMKNMTPEQRAAFLRQYGLAMNADLESRLKAIDNTSFADSSTNGALMDGMTAYGVSLNQHLNDIAQMHADSINAAMGRNDLRVRPEYMGQPATSYQMGQRSTPVTSPSPVDVNNGRNARANTAGPIPGRSTPVEIK